jgi:hypothetical protein
VDEKGNPLKMTWNSSGNCRQIPDSLLRATVKYGSKMPNGFEAKTLIRTVEE